MICFSPYVGKTKLFFRGSRFLHFQNCIYLFFSCLFTIFTQTTISQTHFGFATKGKICTFSKPILKRLLILILAENPNWTFFFHFQVNSHQWNQVNEEDWPSKSIVALIEWLPNLTKTTMPSILRQKLLNPQKTPINVASNVLPTLDESEIEHLVQWSDMLVFDYLTGNYDRVSSMQVSFD